MKELIDRINALARKSREEGLTEEEKIEQAELRRQYIQKFRQGGLQPVSDVLQRPWKEHLSAVRNDCLLQVCQGILHLQADTYG